MITNFSNILKEIRKLNNVTQKEFSETLNVSRSAIAQIEIGNNKPSSELVDNILANFKVTNSQKDYLLKNVGVNTVKNEVINNKHFRKKTNILEKDSTQNDYEILNLHSQFVSIMDSIERILQISMIHAPFESFEQKEVDVLKDLNTLILEKPFLILLGKSNISIDDYKKELEIKYLLAKSLLSEYIDKLYMKINNLKEGEQLSFSYEDLLPLENLEYTEFEWTKEDSVKAIKEYLDSKKISYTDDDLNKLYKKMLDK
jgi:transcriptional regulator with XRE-family HTH domain